MTVLTLVGPRKVRVSCEGVASFNRAWPCSELRSSRAYWFEYDAAGDLVDHDIPESDDGGAASAMSDDCKAWLFVGETPEWAPDNPDASEPAALGYAHPFDDGVTRISPDRVPFYVAEADPGAWFAHALDGNGDADSDNVLGPFKSENEADTAGMTPGAWR